MIQQTCFPQCIANTLKPHEGKLGNSANPIRVLTPKVQHGDSRKEDNKQRLNQSKLSFGDALLGKDEQGMLKKPIPKSRRERGNIVVDLDVDDCRRGVLEFIYSVVGHLSLQKGDSLYMNKAVKEKLQFVWGFANFKLILLRGGLFHV